MRGSPGQNNDIIWRAVLWVIVAAFLAVMPGVARAQLANSCNSATTQGAAPADFQGYCWLDLTGYNDATARTAGGQAFGWNLPDGTRVTATLSSRLNGGKIVGNRRASIVFPLPGGPTIKTL